MKILSIYISTCLLFFATSCTLTTHNKSNLNKKIIVQNGRGKGGNSEVKIINQCLKKIKNQERDKCLDIFYPNNINITIYPSTREIIKLAGRTSSIEKREFNLGGEDRFILHLDISEVELPVNCNIKTAKLSHDETSLVVDIDIKDIKKRVTLYDKNNKLLLDYTIIKN